MSYPSLEQYNTALQHPNVCLVDPQLRVGQIKKTGLGLPFAMCGGFALTYTLTVDNEKVAIRCFHKMSPNLERRYSEISQRLRQLNSPYFVNFIFHPQGISINRVKYPIVQMAWANGETLGEFLEKNYKDKNKLLALIESFRRLGTYLESNHIAHGDIQPGNVMVSNDGKNIQLIDYDGMYVENLNAVGSSELGHRNFQHPERRNNTWDHKLDRFSLILFDFSLRLLVDEPDLWKNTRSDAETVLFKANDFASPENSATFDLISQYPKYYAESRYFASICSSSYSQIPSLNQYLLIKKGPFTHLQTGPKIFVQQPYASPYTVIDATDYLKGRIHVGDRVELIGKIEEVKFGKTRYTYKDYIFINFDDWRGERLKIAIWADGLEQLTDIPDSTWEGKWISVVGLLDPPYTGNGYTHISINVTQQSQMRIIPQEEAEYRLGKRNDPLIYKPVVQSPPPQETTSTDSKNRDIVDEMNKKVTGNLSSNTTIPRAPTPRYTPPVPSNPKPQPPVLIPQSTNDQREKNSLIIFLSILAGLILLATCLLSYI